MGARRPAHTPPPWSHRADVVSAYNLVICHYALGQPVKMEEWFSRMLDVQVPGVSVEEEEEAEDEEADEDAADPTVGSSRDKLAQEVKERCGVAAPPPPASALPHPPGLARKKHAQGLVSKAARLIAPALDKEEWVNGASRPRCPRRTLGGGGTSLAVESPPRV